MRRDELYHFGVKGMHWGVRRNLSELRTGLLRRRSKPQRSVSKDYEDFQNLSKKKSYEMSNQELQRYNNRRNLESQYKRFNPSTVAKALGAIATVGATATAINKTYGTGKVFVRNLGEVKDFSKKYGKTAEEWVTNRLNQKRRSR